VFNETAVTLRLPAAVYSSLELRMLLNLKFSLDRTRMELVVKDAEGACRTRSTLTRKLCVLVVPPSLVLIKMLESPNLLFAGRSSTHLEPEDPEPDLVVREMEPFGKSVVLLAQASHDTDACPSGSVNETYLERVFEVFQFIITSLPSLSEESCGVL
jgi:hypothetical protein